MSLSPSHVSPSQDSAHLLVSQRTLRSGKTVTTETGLIPSIPLNSGTLINRQFTSTLKGHGQVTQTDQSKSLYGSKITGNGLGRKRNRDEINKENVMEEEEEEEEEVTTRRQTKRRFLIMDDSDNEEEEEEEEEVEKEEKEEEEEEKEEEESISSVLCKRFPGRQKQINTLLSLMGKVSQNPLIIIIKLLINS